MDAFCHLLSRPLSTIRLPVFSMELTRLLDPSSVAVGVEVSDKESLLNAAIDLVADQEGVLDADAMREAVFEREKTMSTGVGKGLGLPHAKTAAVDGIMAALVVCKYPVDFESIDNEPVRIIFLLVGKQDAKSQHVRILSRISRMMNQKDTRERILAAATSEELLSVIEEVESQLN
jgi:mannitol/fructose-specific phosphotransferase system IIA component (Ntr-type)